MKCEYNQDQMIDWINGQMSTAESVSFEMHLANCTVCRQELENLRDLLNLMDELPKPEPSPTMRIRFQTMLETYRDSLEEKRNPVVRLAEKFRQIWSLQPGLQLAYSIALIFAGLLGGYLLNNRSSGTAGNSQIDSLSTQVHEMREMMMLSLLENPSASERIRGVSYSNEIKRANKPVVDALLSTLNNDPNVNVRLMTLDALTHFANDPVVREGLVQSILQQESPLLQSALADVMLKLQEKSSIPAFKKLLMQKDLNHLVRSKIEQTITELI
jgi:hypothetical protein